MHPYHHYHTGLENVHANVSSSMAKRFNVKQTSSVLLTILVHTFFSSLVSVQSYSKHIQSASFTEVHPPSATHSLDIT